MIRKNTLIGAAGAGALVAVALVGPASAAGEETATVNYSCSDRRGHARRDLRGRRAARLDGGRPDRLAAHHGDLLADARPTTALAKTVLGGTATTQFSGTITTTASNTAVGQNITLPKTTLGNDTGGATLVTNATGTTKLRYTDGRHPHRSRSATPARSSCRATRPTTRRPGVHVPQLHRRVRSLPQPDAARRPCRRPASARPSR